MSKKDKITEEQMKEDVQLENQNDEVIEQPETKEEEDLTTLIEENNQLKDKYLRILAEFENFKKRTVKEKMEFMKNAAQDTMTALLPVLDDFDRAKKSADDENNEEVFSEGVALVYQKLKGVLKNRGLEQFEPTGEDFDPELHEAITEIPGSKKQKGKVVDTIEKGYRLNDKIIRHAKVVVGK